LLLSGGHSLLAVVEDVDKFYMLGTTLDNAPGEVLDKVHLQIIIYVQYFVKNLYAITIVACSQTQTCKYTRIFAYEWWSSNRECSEEGD